jgi:hypothetical protein
LAALNLNRAARPSVVLPREALLVITGEEEHIVPRGGQRRLKRERRNKTFKPFKPR